MKADKRIRRMVHGEMEPRANRQISVARRCFCLCLSLGVCLGRPRRSDDFQSRGHTGQATRAGESKCQNTI